MFGKILKNKTSDKSISQNILEDFNTGNDYYKKGELNKALEYYNRCLKISPEAPVRNNIGEIYLLKNDLDKAFEIFSELTEKYPDYPFGHYNIGLIYQKRGDNKKSVESFNKAIKINPLGKFYNSLSAVYCDQRKFDKAVNSLLKALKIEPDYIVSHINLSKIYLIQKKFSLALSHCEKALKISEKDPVVYSQMGAIFQKQGDFEKAINYYTKSLELSPEIPQVHYNLGTLFESKKLYSGAVYHYTSYLNLTCEKTIKNPLDKEIEEKIETLKNNPGFFLEQGSALYSKNELEEAEKLWIKALEIDPEFTPASILLGALYEKQEKWDKAINEYRKVMKSMPHMTGIRDSLNTLERKING